MPRAKKTAPPAPEQVKEEPEKPKRTWKRTTKARYATVRAEYKTNRLIAHAAVRNALKKMNGEYKKAAKDSQARTLQYKSEAIAHLAQFLESELLRLTRGAVAMHQINAPVRKRLMIQDLKSVLEANTYAVREVVA